MAKALDILGERWTLLIVRDLLLGPRRFSDIKRSLHGIAPNLLSARLQALGDSAVVERQGANYALTERGRQLEGVILGLGAFGSLYMGSPAKGETMDPRHAMLSLKRRYRPSKHVGNIAIECGDASFGVRIGGPTLEVWDGAPRAPDLSLRGPFAGWFRLLSRGRSLRDLEADGLIARDGPARLAQGFVRSIGALP